MATGTRLTSKNDSLTAIDIVWARDTAPANLSSLLSIWISSSERGLAPNTDQLGGELVVGSNRWRVRRDRSGRNDSMTASPLFGRRWRDRLRCVNASARIGQGSVKVVSR
jgi:hypothetical protein